MNSSLQTVLLSLRQKHCDLRYVNDCFHVCVYVSVRVRTRMRACLPEGESVFLCPVNKEM